MGLLKAKIYTTQANPSGKQIEKQCEHAHWVSTWHSNMITRTFHTIQMEDCKNTKQMKNNKQINDDEQSIKVLMHPLGRPHSENMKFLKYMTTGNSSFLPCDEKAPWHKMAGFKQHYFIAEYLLLSC